MKKYNMSSDSSKQYLQLITLIAALFMLLPIPVLQYIGEEAVYALKSYEMFISGNYWSTPLLGRIWPHSPFSHWIVIGICQVIGWEYVDITLRFISVSASWVSALVAGLMARHLFPQHPNAVWIAAVVYLTLAEVAFWYGWLGHVDALFGCFIFSSVAMLWRAMEKQSLLWLLGSLILISLAFMVKNITAYALYGLAGMVLIHRLNCYRLLKNPGFLIFGASALLLPYFINSMASQHFGGNAGRTFQDALNSFKQHPGILNYLSHAAFLPLAFFCRTMPISLFIVWLWLKRKQIFKFDKQLITLTWVIFACFLPYWISPGSSPRYIVPLYGFVALLLTGLVIQLKPQHFRTTLILMVIFIALKVPYSFGILPYIKDWRPDRDMKVVAQEIIQLTENAPLRTLSEIPSGYSIAAYINVWRQERPPIHWYDGHEKGVFIMSQWKKESLGQIVKTWHLRGSLVYLYWQPN